MDQIVWQVPQDAPNLDTQNFLEDTVVIHPWKSRVACSAPLTRLGSFGRGDARELARQWSLAMPMGGSLMVSGAVVSVSRKRPENGLQLWKTVYSRTQGASDDP
jgi:hypothetical protein